MQVRVVIVDDDAGFRRVAALLLTVRGYEVVGEAADAESALRLVAAERPDAALIDQHLAADDGARLSRALLALPHPPRVLLTSSDTSVAQLPGPEVPFLPKERLAAADLHTYL